MMKATQVLQENDRHGWSSEGVLDRLDQPAVRLKQFIGGIEGQFSSVGDNLRRFHRSSRSISDRSTALVALLLSDNFNVTFGNLEGLLNRISKYASALEEESNRTLSSLRQMVSLLERAIEPVAGFRKIVKTMTILGLSTKIESANQYIVDDSFDILADDLKLLAIDVGKQSSQILSQLESLNVSVREALDRVSELSNWQKNQSRRIINNARVSVSSIREKNQSAMEKTRVIADHSRDISMAIGEIVSSMQFHDLARQQMEHVMSALSDLRGAMKEQMVRDGDSFSLDGFGPVLAEITRLQGLQILNTKDDLVSAVIRIMESLREVGVSVTEMASETKDIAGASERDGSSFLTQMEASISAIATSLRDNAMANQESVRTINSIADNIERMEGFLSGIEQIGAKMKILALNAGIQAAHADFGGAGLSVIAESVQQLSAAALLQTGVVSRILRDITSESKQLFADSGDLDHGQDDTVSGYVEDLNKLLEVIDSTNREVLLNLGEIDGESRQLASELEFTTRSITVHEKAAKELDHVKRILDGLYQEARERSGGRKASAHLTPVLKELSSRYTMNSEREMHRLVRELGDREVGLKDLKSIKAKREVVLPDDGFGDNVELF